MTGKSPTSHPFAFNVDHAMVCRRGGFIIQRHNELRDVEADMLSMVCNDVEIEPVLQELTGESLPSGANRAPDAHLDIFARGFWERQRSAFFDVRVCHPNADSYRDLDLKQVYKQHENDKRLYTQRVMDVEQGTFTPLVFTRTGGMGEECKRYHNRLAELVAAKKKERTMPTPSLEYDLKSPLPSLGQLYSALEGREHLKGQLEVMFKKRTLN